MVKVYDGAVVMDYCKGDHNILIDLDTYFPYTIYSGYQIIARVGSATIYLLSRKRQTALVTNHTENSITIKVDDIEYIISNDILGIVKLYISSIESEYIINKFHVTKLVFGFVVLLLIILAYMEGLIKFKM